MDGWMHTQVYPLEAPEDFLIPVCLSQAYRLLSWEQRLADLIRV